MEKMISIMKIRWSKDSIIKGKWRMKDKKMDERRENIYLIYELQRWSSSSNSSWTHVEAGEDVGAEQLHWTLMMINWMHLWTAHESVKCFLFNQIVCFKFTFIHSSIDSIEVNWIHMIEDVVMKKKKEEILKLCCYLNWNNKAKNRKENKVKWIKRKNWTWKKWNNKWTKNKVKQEIEPRENVFKLVYWNLNIT